MNGNDRELGMHRPSTGATSSTASAVALGASLLPKWSWALALDAQAAGQGGERRPYPPRRTGMRGSHAGSFELSHQLRDGRRVDLAAARRTPARPTTWSWSAAGLSGLAAAYYFVANVGRDARVLVLDNHDDFGGHAKRNEFVVDGKLLALNGGTLNIESPLRYNQPSRQLLAGIGVDLDRFVKNNEANRGLYSVARPAQRPLLRQGDVGQRPAGGAAGRAAARRLPARVSRR